MMKRILVLTLLFCAAFAQKAAEDVYEDLKAVEAAEVAPEEQVEAVAEAVDEAPVEAEVAAEAPVSLDVAPADERFVSCPSGWFFHGTRCFLLSTSSRNWFDAENHCKSLGAHLASATSLSEYSFLQQLTQLGRQSRSWIGGFYLQGRWLWIDGQGMSYSKWYNTYTPTTYSCIHLYTNLAWSNKRCTEALYYICSKDLITC